MPDNTLQAAVATLCRRIDALDPTIQALLPEPDRCQRLFKEAQALARRHPEQKPLLYGLSVGVKDLYNVHGMPTRAGSRLPESAFCGEEASIVTMLKTLGALIIGKTVSTEFAYFQPGPTRNPINPEHSPGGSSSGSAAAVAAGMCDFALGTQTIASVIRPAAFCGIVGFKPSYGLLPMDGVFPFSQAADHPGFFSRDLDTMLRVMAAILPGWMDLGKGKPVLGIPSEAFLSQADSEARAALEGFVREASTAGLTVIQTGLYADIQTINQLHFDLISREFHLNHTDLFAIHGKLYSAASVELYLKGQSISETRADAARAARIELRDNTADLMRQEGIDLWISPSTTSAAPRGLASTGSPLMSLPFTFCGLPALSVPYGTALSGLPLGIQFCAAFGKDAWLLGSVKDLMKTISQG